MSKLPRKRNPEVLRQILAAYGSRVTLAYSISAYDPVHMTIDIDALKHLRIERGWSQMKLATRAEVDQSTIAQIECGKIKHPSQRKLTQIANALGVSISTIIKMEALAE